MGVGETPLVHTHFSETFTRMVVQNNAILPLDRLNRLENFGHSIVTIAYVYRPTHMEQVAELFDLACQRGTKIAFRGSGLSYGDASLNSGGIVLDTRRMNRVLAWNPDTGVIRVEPGITIQQLWMYTIEDGWWPPVVPGTMFPTLGGCLATNIHGKNNWQKGTIGEHVLEFIALLPNGEEITCTPTENSDLFYAMIGGVGMLGMFTSITLQMKRIYSGNLRVETWTEPGLTYAIAAIDAHKTEYDYIVGWIDCTVDGERLGRGQIHTADYLAPGEDASPAQTQGVDYQMLPDTFFGLIPKSIVWRFMRLLFNNPGIWVTNSAKYTLDSTIGNRKRYLQSHVAFNFLLDYVPNWERAHGKGGMIQYQCLIPHDTAPDAFREIIKLGLRRRLPNYLGVLKRHRSDKFLLTHAVDGFSLAQDYRLTDRNREKLHRMTADLDQIVLEAGGRFYFAKDSTLSAEVVHGFLGQETVRKFRALKARCDPEGVLESDLYRRCFGSTCDL